MVKWELSDNEVSNLKNFMSREIERLDSIASMNKSEKTRESADARRVNLKRLLKSLESSRELTNLGFDTICYCDSNYDFHTSTLSISYRIGDNPEIHRQVMGNMPPPPDEYLGIMAVLKTIKEKGIKGKVQIVTDASRCALALQMGLRYRVPKHSENQSPRSVNFGFSYDSTIALTKDLEKDGCHVEFSYRNRGFINDALKLA